MNKNEEFISITVYLYIEFDERIINESLNFNFNSNIYVKDMIKVIIENYNHYFEEQKINIKLKSEGLGYELVNYESSENIKHKKPFSKIGVNEYETLINKKNKWHKWNKKNIFFKNYLIYIFCYFLMINY